MEDSVELEISDEAMILGILKPIIICVVLLSSGIVGELPERTFSLWDRGQDWGVGEE